jgi:hypothetical protein
MADEGQKAGRTGAGVEKRPHSGGGIEKKRRLSRRTKARESDTAHVAPLHREAGQSDGYTPTPTIREIRLGSTIGRRCVGLDGIEDLHDVVDVGFGEYGVWSRGSVVDVRGLV